MCILSIADLCRIGWEEKELLIEAQGTSSCRSTRWSQGWAPEHCYSQVLLLLRLSTRCREKTTPSYKPFSPMLIKYFYYFCTLCKMVWLFFICFGWKRSFVSGIIRDFCESRVPSEQSFLLRGKGCNEQAHINSVRHWTLPGLAALLTRNAWSVQKCTWVCVLIMVAWASFCEVTRLGGGVWSWAGRAGRNQGVGQLVTIENWVLVVEESGSRTWDMV